MIDIALPPFTLFFGSVNSAKHSGGQWYIDASYLYRSQKSHRVWLQALEKDVTSPPNIGDLVVATARLAIGATHCHLVASHVLVADNDTQAAFAYRQAGDEMIQTIENTHRRMLRLLL